jgi:hypothetical protein
MLQWNLFHRFNLKYASLLNCFQRDIYCFHLFMCFEIKCAIPSVSPITSKKLPLARNLRVIMTCCSTVRAWFLLVSLSMSFLTRSDKNIMLSLPNRYLSQSSLSVKSRESASLFRKCLSLRRCGTWNREKAAIFNTSLRFNPGSKCN